MLIVHRTGSLILAAAFSHAAMVSRFSRAMSAASTIVATTVDAFGEADVVRVPALIGKLCRILKHQDRSVRCGIPRLRCLEMACKDVPFLDLWVGKEPISGFGACPVLTGQRDCSSHSVAQAAKQIGHLEEPADSGLSGLVRRWRTHWCRRIVGFPANFGVFARLSGPFWALRGRSSPFVPDEASQVVG